MNSKNFFNFIDEATKDEKLRKEMLRVAKRKNIKAETLLRAFHRNQYDGVSLRDCRTILSILSDPIQLQRVEEWHY